MRPGFSPWVRKIHQPGNVHVTAALLKGTLDGTQAVSWFGGSRLRARWLEKNWASNEGDRVSRGLKQLFLFIFVVQEIDRTRTVTPHAFRGPVRGALLVLRMNWTILSIPAPSSFVEVLTPSTSE